MATLFGGIETGRNKREQQSASLFNGGGTLFSGKYDTAGVQRQIDNASLRIQDSGYKVDNSDGRNGLERALNLPSGQNAFFDVLEVIQRPFQGVANVVDKSLFNGTQGVGEAFTRGIAGKDRVRGADLAENLQVTNPVGKAVLGTALEIGLDPVTYIPGGIIAKGVKTAAKPLFGIAKAGANQAMKIPAINKAFDETIKPMYSSAKDKLGYMFNADYKANETLFGGKSDFLTDTYRTTENNRRFMQEEYTNKLLGTAKGTGVDAGDEVGRVMESSLKQYDDAGNLLPRPARQISTDPKVLQAAQDLMATNAEIRHFATTEGIDINDLQGYMTHILSQEERALRKKNKVLKVDQGQFNTANPNKKVIQQRKLIGSAEDVNDEVGRKLFEPNAYFATAVGQRRLVDYISAVSFRKKILDNTDFAVKFDDYVAQHGTDLPKDAAVIDVNNYRFMDPTNPVPGVIDSEIGGRYVVTKAAKEKLDRYKYATTDEGSKAFLRALDTAQSWWKRLALFSVPYHIRNDVGAKFNMWVAGMNPNDLALYGQKGYAEAINAVRGKESNLFKEYRKQGLSSSSQSQIEFARYGQEPEEAVEKLVREGAKGFKGKVKDRLNPLRAFETSRELGDIIDQANRFAVFKWAVEKKGKSFEEAAQMVREALFDYTKLTNFERQFMTRLMPFYRWMRNNLPFQVSQFIKDPRKYSYLNKARLNMQEAAGINDENVPDYMKESFSLPVWMDEEGKGKMLGFNLPLGDLTKLSDPLKLGVDALSPALKLPIELSTNYNMFYGKPIEKFQGQEKQYTLFGMQGGIPAKTAYALEQATGQIGRGLSGYLQKPEDADQDTKFRMPSFGISSILKDFDVEAANYYELRDKLKQLQDYINYIEQQEGVRPRAVNEIRAQ